LLVACRILPEYYCTDAHIFSVGRSLAECLGCHIGIFIFGPQLITNLFRLSYLRRHTHIIGQVRRHYQDDAYSSRLRTCWLQTSTGNFSFLAHQRAVAFCAAKRQTAGYHTREGLFYYFFGAHTMDWGASVESATDWNTWRNGLFNEVCILCTAVAAVHCCRATSRRSEITVQDYHVAINRFTLDTNYCSRR